MRLSVDTFWIFLFFGFCQSFGMHSQGGVFARWKLYRFEKQFKAHSIEREVDALEKIDTQRLTILKNHIGGRYIYHKEGMILYGSLCVIGLALMYASWRNSGFAMTILMGTASLYSAINMYIGQRETNILKNNVDADGTLNMSSKRILRRYLDQSIKNTSIDFPQYKFQDPANIDGKRTMLRRSGPDIQLLFRELIQDAGHAECFQSLLVGHGNTPEWTLLYYPKDQ